MSDYEKLLKEVVALACANCKGFGEIDDAEPGDIAFNVYSCQACDRTGFKEGKKCKLFESK